MMSFPLELKLLSKFLFWLCPSGLDLETVINHHATSCIINTSHCFA